MMNRPTGQAASFSWESRQKKFLIRREKTCKERNNLHL